MPLDIQNTTLAGAPYFDDFANAEANNYHRVLFKPSVAVQARELNQLQTILQNQVERFGSNVYKAGTIIDGCNIIYDDEYSYIKIADQQLSGISIDVDVFANTVLVSSDGLQAVVVNQVSGLIATAPDLNTLYVKYVSTGTGTYTNGSTFDTKVFTANSTLTSYNRLRTLESVQVTAGGVAYSNADVVEIAANNDLGAGARATLTTFSNGTISSVTVTTKGSGYVNPPTVTIKSTSGSGAQLTAINYVGQVVIANSSLNPIGSGYAATMDNGIIYQKGHFLNVERQTTIISKYSTIRDGQPDGITLGFQTTESIVNSYSDDMLLDNSTGSTNEMAPGADRLQLTPTLVAVNTNTTDTLADFLTIVEFQGGYPVRSNLNTVFNSFSTEAAKRTFEESGDYVVTPYGVYTEQLVDRTGSTPVANVTHVNAVITPGIAYVGGVRTEITGNYRVPLRKSTDTKITPSQYISTNFGNFVYVNNLAGNGFNPVQSSNVVIYSTAMAAANSTNYGGNLPAGSGSIGSARVRGLEYDTGTPGTAQGQYRMYLYDIKMNPGKSFSDARAIGISSTAAADIVTSGNSSVQKAKLYDVNKDGLVFKVGANSVKSVNNATLVYRTVNTGIQFATTGNTQITFSSSDTTFPYTPGASLSATEENDFIFVPTSNAQTTNIGGWSASVTNGNNLVTGVGTTFTTTFSVGDYIYLANSTANVVHRVTQIESNLKLYTDINYSAALTGNVAIYFPKYQPLNLQSRNLAAIFVNSANTVTADLGLTALGYTLTAPLPVTAYYSAKVTNPPLRTKKIQKDVYVKLSTDATTTSPNGPWCLGIPDVHKITGVYLSSGNNYAANSTNYSTLFELDNGQRDNSYGLSYIRKLPSSTIQTAGASIVVKLDAYYGHSDVTGGAYFAGPASYPIDDVYRSANTISIPTEEIEVFTSTRDGAIYDLRDSVDFRPLVANTANVVATALSGATIDPSNVEAIAVSPNYFPTPTKYMIADLETYQSRIDKVYLTTSAAGSGVSEMGRIGIIEGVPSSTPRAPNAPTTSMTIGTLHVPPYPSLDPISASRVGRSELAVLASTGQQHKRYTMQEISNFDKRIERLEYYSLLNRLESRAMKDAQSQTALNGFIVDSFTDFNTANLADTEFNAFIDTAAGILRPRIKAEDVDLKFDPASIDTTNVRANPDMVSLPYTANQMLFQTFATNERNLAGELWRFKGKLTAYPKYDGQYDKDVAPVNITIDLAGFANTLITGINAALLAMDGKATVTGTTVSSVNDGSNITTTTTTTGIKQNSQLTATSTSSSSTFGTVSDISFKPYMRAAVMVFTAFGLRPNARHYVFFDGVNVDQYTIPANYTLKETGGAVNQSTVQAVGVLGGELRADSTGALAGIFMLPAETFFVGERTLSVLDVPQYTSSAAAVSYASTQYNAYNLDVSKQQITLSTKTLEKVSSSLVTTFTGTLRTDVTVVALPPPVWAGDGGGGGGGDGGGGDGGGGGGGGSDPLAQTFTIPNELRGTAEGVYITAIDVFFATKSLDNSRGCSLQVRNVVNGYPGPVIIPYGTKWLPSDSIRVSADGREATSYTFDAPVFLKSGEEYCFVLIPDGNVPDFYMWSGVAGNEDVFNKAVSRSDWGFGQMFTSVNNTAWNPHSLEDVKFRIWRANFTGGATGSAAFTHDDYEFLTLSSPTGGFTRGEKVAQKSTSYLTGSISTLTANLTNGFLVTGANTTFTSKLNTGDNLLITYGFDPGANLSGTVAATTTAANLVGTSTAFATEITVGDYLLVGGEARQVVNISSDTNLTMDAPVTVAVSSGTTFSKLGSVVYDIASVNAISSDTAFKLSKGPKYSQINPVAAANTLSSTTYMRVTTGVVDRYRINEQKLYLKKSTASNSTNKFVQSAYDSLANDSGRSIVCELSSGVANVASVDNFSFQYVAPKIDTIIPTGTSIARTYKTAKVGETVLNSTSGEEAVTTLPFVSEIRSRSNEIDGSSVVSSLRISEVLQTGTNLLSPVIDISPISVELIANQVDNYTTFKQQATFSIGSTTVAITDGTQIAVGMGIRGVSIPIGATVTAITGNTVTISKPTTGATLTTTLVEFHPNEVNRFGISKNKYLSKFIELADGLEAEDLKVFLTSFRPLGTDVDVYVKLLHEVDSETVSNKEWTLLEKTATTSVLYSNPGNPDDTYEYTYVLPKSAPFVRLTGKANTSTVSTTITMDTTGLANNELVVGDLVKIVKADSSAANGTIVAGSYDDYDVRTVTAIASNTAFTIDAAPSFTLAGAFVERITQPRAAFRYNRTTPQYMSLYHGSAGDGSLTAQYIGYKYMSIKIVLRSTDTLTVPHVTDMRAIATLI